MGSHYDALYTGAKNGMLQTLSVFQKQAVGDVSKSF